MRNFLIAAAAATALSASNASAADIAAKPYVKAPPVPVYNWTGFYIGGNVGGQWLDSGYDASYPPLALVGSRGLRHTSVIGGGQIGYPAGHFKFLRVWSVKFLHPARQDMMIVSLTLFPGQGLQRPL